MTTKSNDSDIQFMYEMGKFIGDHLPQIMEILGEDRVKQLADIWDENKVKK